MEKFDIVSNDHGRTPKYNILDKFGPKYQKLSVKAKTWYIDYFEYAEFNDDVHFFCFQLEIPVLGKIGPKNQNC